MRTFPQTILQLGSLAIMLSSRISEAHDAPAHVKITWAAIQSSIGLNLFLNNQLVPQLLTASPPQAGGNHSLAVVFSTFVQYQVDVTKDLLLIYNTNFSITSTDDFRDMFLATGIGPTISTIGQDGPLIPVYVYSDQAEYYFTQTIDGQDIGIIIDFVKENGVWRILEF
jgi:hypothetical protein